LRKLGCIDIFFVILFWENFGGFLIIAVRFRDAYLQIVMHYSAICLIPIAALTQSIEMNWRDGVSNPKFLQHSAVILPAFQLLDHVAALKIERKNVAFKHQIRLICFDRHCIIWK